MSNIEKRTRRVYDEADVARGLGMLIACAGNTAEASRRLAEEGHTYDAGLLRSWRLTTHAERYQELMAKHRPEIDARMISQARAIIEAAGAVEELALERTRESLTRGQFDRREVGPILEQIAAGEISTDEGESQIFELAYVPVDAKDASAILKNTTVAKAINVDKVAVAEGRPTTITKALAGDELMRALQAQGLLDDTVDGEATEVQAAQLQEAA